MSMQYKTKHSTWYKGYEIYIPEPESVYVYNKYSQFERLYNTIGKAKEYIDSITNDNK